MFDDLFDIFSGHNLLEPLRAGACDAINGPSTLFTLSNMSGHSRRFIRNALKQNGVDCWDDMQSDCGFYIHIRVKQDDTDKAYQSLTGAGVVVIAPKLED